MNIEKVFSRYAPFIPDFYQFLQFLNKPPVQSFRINTLKAKRSEILTLLKNLKLKPLPFYEDGFFLEERCTLGNHLTHNLGLIYVQEIASMIPTILLDPKPGEVVLDLCAAPGSKTTQIAQFMGNTGLIVANEISLRRMRGLNHNIKRCGLLNEVVISIPGRKIHNTLSDYFDRVLIDAPCSAEGTVRKSKAILHHWGLRNIQRMARIQKGLINSAFKVLKPGGTMVYSTCTIAPEENEGVISYLLEKFPEAELLPINISNFKIRPGITKWQNISFDKRIKHCARILPQDNDTAPFFIAKITKRGIYKPRIDYFGKIDFDKLIVEKFSQKFGVDVDRFKRYSVFKNRDKAFISTPEVFSFREVKVSRKGLEFGRICNHEIWPDNDFIQIFGHGARRNCFELREWQAKKFLRGETIKVSNQSDIEKGFIIVFYKTLPIGIGKYNGQEIKSEVKRERRMPSF